MRPWLIWFGFILVTSKAIHSFSISQLIQQLQRENSFEYILIIGETKGILPRLFSELSTPVILEKNSNISYSLNKHYSRRLLCVAFVDKSIKGLLEFYNLNLQLWNTEPLFLIMKKHTKVGILESLWRSNQLINVLAIFEDFEDTGLVYDYSPFPDFRIEERRISESTSPIIKLRLGNLNGYKLPFMVGGSTPRLIIYRRPAGDLFYAGFVGHLKHCFEVKYNCQLVEPLPMNESSLVPALQLLGAVRNSSVQFAFAATFTEPPIDGYIYPFELMNWCFMMPVPEQVPHSQLYSRVLNLNTLMIVLGALIMISILLSLTLRFHGYDVQPYDFLLHDNCLRGVLGQCFNEVLQAPTLVRGIYLEICILGFLFTAWYNSYFSAYITSGPYQKPFSSFETILKANFKIFFWSPEYQKLVSYSEDIKQYEAIFKLEPSYSKFLQIRDSFDTRYGYMMPLEKWNLVNQQQKFFSSPLFTFRDDLCVFRTVPVAFPIVNNSVFREPLERLIGEVTATGLMDHWRDNAFVEMIKAGKLKILDLGKRKKFRAMKLEDLKNIVLGGALMIALASIVFVLEHIWFRLNMLRNL